MVRKAATAGSSAFPRASVKAVHTAGFTVKESSEEVIALKGKTLRRSHDRANRMGAAHGVSVWMGHRRLILGQIERESKSTRNSFTFSDKAPPACTASV